MHNKTLTADGRFTMLGGRNVGDRYFGLFQPFVQDDLDVLVAGAAVPSVVATFDAFWNDASTFPVTWFARDKRPRQPLDATRAELAVEAEQALAVLAPTKIVQRDWTDYLETLVDTFTSGVATVVWDSTLREAQGGVRLYDDFKALIASAQQEVLISSPYFIPDAGFRELLEGLAARGVRVAVLTNSLATNNHVIAHTGYRRFRRELLAAGVELYELRRDADALSLYRLPVVEPAGLGLHTKAVVVDGRRAFVGSPNVDPRSMELNTEIGVIVEGETFASGVHALIDRDMSPANAWRVTMKEGGWLRWSHDDEVLRRQPARGFVQRALEFLLNLLPLKDQA